MKVAVIGGECSGKSTLAKKLALYHKGHVIFEYLRTYCNKYSIPTTMHEQYHIAYAQIKLETLASIKSSLIFCDSTPLLTYAYSLYYLKHIYTLKQLKTFEKLAINHQKSYKLTLLLQPIIKWQADIQRDSPHARLQIYKILKNLLIQHNIHFNYISLPKDKISDIITLTSKLM